MYSKLQDGSFIVCGYVARDSELKTVGEKHSSLCRWSVKVGEEVKPSGKKEAKWTNCQAWHDIARYAATIKKGDTVLCVGRLEKSIGSDGKEYKNLVCEFVSVMKAVPKEQSVVLPPEGENELVDLTEYEEILNDGDTPF